MLSDWNQNREELLTSIVQLQERFRPIKFWYNGEYKNQANINSCYCSVRSLKWTVTSQKIEKKEPKLTIGSLFNVKNALMFSTGGVYAVFEVNITVRERKRVVETFPE